ncbi:50S ribosomal protein L35 [Candidatus Roizmanbacteria bacterium RIFCSPLOWO2_01_FULL_41_22]|uniref:Large ribosomal subunit protein bL35 n=2 Tax=Candidatus Roizmaniibacteriota TaxID=1752723 RepID=A0A1F7JQN7_9BACT|nr:MAG: 50S ribosomal protein L35 [Candidatus Roizmanbacteria bacterium RIFCSPLOWO2_01_FULL_41_22]OGK57929.1 MAG: 50S ribosomal protein L35 [Candidatus Roizmanbacteria bacterium RIFCSPLOWO2_02_FULL_41_9]
MKQRTRKSAAKRFKITNTGKVLRRSHNIRHLKSSKSKRQIRSLNRIKVVNGRIEKKIKKMMAVA